MSLPRIAPSSSCPSNEKESVSPCPNTLVDDELPVPPPPEGGLRGWATVAGSFLCMAAVFGLNNSAGVLQPYWTSHQLRDFSTSDVSWIPGFANGMCLFLGIYVGPLFDKFGPRPLLLPVGSAMFVMGLFGLAFLPTFPSSTVSGPVMYAAIFLAWGLVMGTGQAVVGCVAIAALAHWFDARRGTAMGIVFVGTSVGGAMFPQVLDQLLDRHGWRISVLLLTVIAAAMLVAGNLLVHGRLPGRRREGGVVDLACFKDARFVWTSVSIALFDLVLTAGFSMAPTWALARGFDSTTSTAVLSVMSAGSGVGRLVAGAIADQLGRYNALILMLIISIVGIFALWLPVTEHTVPLYYVCGAFFGYGTGSVVSVAPVCFGQLTTTDKFGLYYGTGMVLVSIAAMVSVPLSAKVLNTFGPDGFVIFLGGNLVLALISLFIARWLIQERRWKWMTWV